MKLMKFTVRGTGADLYVHPSRFVGMIVGGNGGGVIREDKTESVLTTLIIDGGPNKGLVTVEDSPEQVHTQLGQHVLSYDPPTLPAPQPA